MYRPVKRFTSEVDQPRHRRQMRTLRIKDESPRQEVTLARCDLIRLMSMHAREKESAFAANQSLNDASARLAAST